MGLPTGLCTRSHENSIDSSDTLCDVANAPRIAVTPGKTTGHLWDILMEIAPDDQYWFNTVFLDLSGNGIMYLHDGALDKHLSLEQLVLRFCGLYKFGMFLDPYQSMRISDCSTLQIMKPKLVFNHPH